MKKILLFFLLCITILSCESDQNKNKTIFFVRHAEKELVPEKDPALTTDGVIRSVDLSAWFKNKALDTIFSTSYLRTIETARPVSEAKNLKIGTYDAKNSEAFATMLMELEMDTILVIGHSNTILEQIEALGAERPQPEIRENEYDKIFEFRVSDNEVVVHTYGTKF